MLKRKIICAAMSLFLVTGMMPMFAFGEEIPFPVVNETDESSDQETPSAPSSEDAPSEDAAAGTPIERPQDEARSNEASPEPAQNEAPVEAVVPNENSWRYDNGLSTTDGIVEGPITLEQRLTEAAGPAGWQVYTRGYFQGEAAFKGIDVSYHQGVIDWQAVKAAGVDFVIIRCGYGDDYRSQDDTQWLRNVQGAREAGIPFGVYLYSYAKQADTWNHSNPQSAQSEAEHVLRCLREAGLEPSQVALPVYYDMEDSSMGTDYAGMAKRFCDIVSSAGYKVGVYASKSWWETKLTDGYFNNVTRWVAQYNSHAGLEYSRFNKDNDIWQFSSSGRIAGITGNVDMNYTNRYVGMVEPGEQVVTDGTYAIKSALDADKAVDIAGGSLFLTANAQLYDANNTAAQRYRFTFADGFYTIVNVGSDLALDVSHGSLDNGANVWQYPQNDTDAQKWRIDRNDDGTFTLVSKKSGRVLDLAEASCDNGANLHQWESHDGGNQRFTLEDMEVKPGTQTLENGTYAISSRLDVNKLIDVSGASVLSGANIQLYQRNDTVAQVFNLTYKDGFYTIINPHSGKALDVSGGSYEINANIQQYAPNGTDAQKWRIDRNIDGTYTFVSKKSGYVLDVAGANTADGTNIQQYKPNGSKAQKFTVQMMQRAEIQSESAIPYDSPAEAARLLTY